MARRPSLRLAASSSWPAKMLSRSRCVLPLATLRFFFLNRHPASSAPLSHKD